MAERKRKVIEEKKVKRKASHPIFPSGEARPQENLLEAWRREVEELRGQRFETMDQLLDVLVVKALRRAPVPEDQQPEVREFLRELLRDDPEISAKLKEIFKVD